jgi:hypothetical protein
LFNVVRALTSSSLLYNRALLLDLLPFSQANPASPNYDPDAQKPLEGEDSPPLTTIGLQPVTGEIVKSVVFSQWTALLDRYVAIRFSLIPIAD